MNKKAIFYAIENKDAYLLRHLFINKKLSPFILDENGFTPLHLTVF
jgi:hypothetical protein